MNKVLIKYELRWDTSVDYKKLYDAIETKYDRVKATNSMYFIKTSSTPAQVNTFIRQYMDEDDMSRCDYISSSHAGIIFTKAVDRLKA